ncbi:MAG: RNA polymerase factor sigma-54 [Candidatus Riflebacteria bacterium]|nr:RNA polymerase factor sigma-54 [Candidatus Riflebacteria bacterium]
MSNGLKLGLSQKMSQTLKMTPEMRLAIKILQLNSIELKDQMFELLETNPVVELDETAEKPREIPLEKLTEPQGTEAIQSKEFQEESRDDFGVDWQKYIADSEATEYKVSSSYSGGDEETSYENFVSKKETLHEFLIAQLPEVNLSQTEEKIGEYLIGLMDRNGYIRHKPEQIAAALKVETSLVEKVLEAIQSMDPVGVGAYDLKDCLLIQAKEEGYGGDAVEAVIQSHLEDIANNKLANIVKATGYDLEEITSAIEVIKSLNPRPGAAFPSQSSDVFVVPEVFVNKVDDEYVVTVNEKDLPPLRISPLYKNAVKNKDKTEKETYEFIKDKLEAARSFIKYVDRRKETILNIAKSIVSFQRDFFDNGILHLKPLTLQDVASETGVHESTVSRATNGKYAQTPRGLFELKFFFSGAAKTTGSSDDISTLAVKRRLEELIKSEDPRKPYSDSKLVSMLKKEGIVLARRTVAKYRIEANIPSSSARKKHI